MKDIKDYLHFYFGCPAQLSLLDEPDPYHIDIDGSVLDMDRNSYHIKPILRQLSDMTEEEIKELINFDKLHQMYADVAFQKVIGYKDIMTAIEIDYTIVEEDYVLPQTWRLDFAAMNAHDFAWCLRKGFDLFGLIADGLAIDKTKMNQN